MAEHSAGREAIAAFRAENDGLKSEMDRLKIRIETLRSAAGAACPLCGQPLSEKHRRSTLDALEIEGQQRGDRFRANKAAASERESNLGKLLAELERFAGADSEKLAVSQAMAQRAERLQVLRALALDWQSAGLARLAVISRQLESGQFARTVREQLSRVDEELSRLGYDAAAHDRSRQAELQQRTADDDHRRLESARAALTPLDNEIQNLESEISNLRVDVAQQASELEKARAAMEAASQSLPDLAEAERSHLDLQEQENRLNQQVGAARQKVSVLDDLRSRQHELEAARQSQALAIGRHKVLERAFSKDGVPALLIEQALPEIETRANEVLDRLSDGSMSVRFMTQAGYKDKKREDLRETLDIQISDGAGPRDYEMYSGGEAFRVNFAIRLALSEVLAGRKGARLQTLVIDEGFGSQDNQGRQRLVEAINLVKNDFAKILVITHLDDLKDAFPTRIEVAKGEHGSAVMVT
jgi:exonuclease SbcC